MKIGLSLRPQHGTALVFSLLILLIMTILGVAAMSNTQMQERMAGNASLQSQAFEAASAGVSESLMFGMNEFFGDPSASEPYDRYCRAETQSDWVVQESTETGLALMEGAAQNATIDYQLRAECLPDPGFDGSGDAPAEGYVTSIGRARSEGVTLAMREVEVRVDDFRSDGRSALRIEGEESSDITVSFNAPNSQEFFVDGQNGPAISTTTQENAEFIQSQIKDQRLANYDGGVAASLYDAPFSPAAEMARFALEVKAFMKYHKIDEEPDNSKKIGTTDPTAFGPAQCHKAELLKANKTYKFGLEEAGNSFSDLEPLDIEPRLSFFPDGASSSKDNLDDLDGITYVGGTLTMGGGEEGTGIIIVEGDIRWHGNTRFKGLVIGMSGNFRFNGAGNEATDGSIYLTNLTDALASLSDDFDNLDLEPASDNTWSDVLTEIYDWSRDGDLSGLTFGNSDMDLRGGGNHRITYDCGLVDQQRMTLSACGKTQAEVKFGSGSELEGYFPGPGDEGLVDPKDFVYDGLADPWWSQLCNTPGKGGTIQAIRSWRENLGWRELVDGGA